MNKKFSLLINNQNKNGGQLRFAELDKDGKVVKDAPVVIISYSDPKEAAKFSVNTEYSITIKPA